MKFGTVIAMALFAVLLTGCLGGGAPSPTPAAQAGGTATPTAGAVASPGGASPSAAQAANVDLTKMAVGEIQKLLGAGQGVKCTATGKHGGTQANETGTAEMTAYFNTEKEAVDMTITSSEGTGRVKTFIDFKTGTAVMYIGGASLAQSQGMENCNWLRTTQKLDAQAQQQAVEGVQGVLADPSKSFSDEAGDSLTGYQTSCNYAVFGNEVFAEPTDKVCDFEEMLRNIQANFTTPGYGQGAYNPGSSGAPAGKTVTVSLQVTGPSSPELIETTLYDELWNPLVTPQRGANPSFTLPANTAFQARVTAPGFAEANLVGKFSGESDLSLGVVKLVEIPAGS